MRPAEKTQILLLSAMGAVFCYLLLVLFLMILDPYCRARIAKALARSTVKKVKIFYGKVLPLEQRALPSKLYRYIRLGAEEAENEKRFATLRRDELWYSRADVLNDLFEGRTLYYSNLACYDEEYEGDNVLAERKTWTQEYLEKASQEVLVCSFCKDPRIPPMWAHYAGEHSGFCVEYEVADPGALYGVEYVSVKEDIGPMMEGLQRELANGEIEHAEFEETLRKLHLRWCTVKSRDWSYEQEVRALLPKAIAPYKGVNYPSSKAGLKLKGVYLGARCSKANRARLQEIAEGLHIFCRETEPDYLGKLTVLKPKA